MSKTNALQDSLKRSVSHGVTERAIEEWLTKASERSYQSAFCHLLNAMGYSVIHSTTHGPAEEGKDVIARDSRNRVYAFQLKRGNINVVTWRAMKSEIEELTEIPIRHPSVKTGTKQLPVLVTTGYINEYVASRIAGMNSNLTRRGFKPLTTWAGSELLMNFMKHTGGFLPQPLTDFHRLLGFMTKRGDGPLDKSDFDLLLRSILPVSDDSKRVTENAAIRSITASTIIGEYALSGYDRMGNHYARIEAYTMLFCYIRALAMKYKLPEKQWKPSVDLLESSLDDLAKRIMEEAASSGGFGQGDPFTEPLVAPYRNTLVGGLLAAHGLWCTLGGPSSWYTDSKVRVVDAVAGCNNKAAVASEAFIPPRFLSSAYLRHNGHVRLGDAIFNELLHIAILRKQDKQNIRPLWDAYLPSQEAMLRDLGKKQDGVFPDCWEIETSTAYTLILVAAGRLMRQTLESLWPAITHLRFTEFVPLTGYERLYWHNKKGKMVEEMARQPQSWTQLLREAATTEKLPRYFKGYEYWVPYYLMVYPHRFEPSLVLAVCKQIAADTSN